MSLVLAVLVAALLLGWARGGTLERLGDLPLRGRLLVPAALVAQVAGALVGGPAYPLGLAAGAGLAAAFLLRNRGTRGTGLVGLGFAANALVVVANGAMPVSLEASAREAVSQFLVRIAVLGLLAESPLHGYELRKRLNALLGTFRAFSYGSLYPTLRRMQASGWVTADSAGRGGRSKGCKQWARGPVQRSSGPAPAAVSLYITRKARRAVTGGGEGRGVSRRFGATL